MNENWTQYVNVVQFYKNKQNHQLTPSTGQVRSAAVIVLCEIMSHGHSIPMFSHLIREVTITEKPLNTCPTDQVELFPTLSACMICCLGQVLSTLKREEFCTWPVEVFSKFSALVYGTENVRMTLPPFFQLFIMIAKTSSFRRTLTQVFLSPKCILAYAGLIYN